MMGKRPPNDPQNEDKEKSGAQNEDPKRKYSLEELLAGMTDDNRHPEFDWGKPVGKEVWWAVNVDREIWDAMLIHLREHVILLSLPGEMQIASYPDFVVVTDELALDYEWVSSFFLSNDEGNLSSAQRELLQGLDDLFTRMSRNGSLFTQDLWTDQGLCQNELWSEIRTAARKLAEVFGWDVPPVP
jgi:hypothetical protein